MTTARSIITDALQKLGVLAAGQPVNAEDANIGLANLNDVIDSLAVQSLYATGTQFLTYVVGADVTEVTIGPAGMIAAPVPVRIEEGAFIRKSAQDYPIHMISRDAYAAIRDKSIGAFSPDVVYYETGPTLGTLTFYPAMSGPGELHLPVQSRVTSFANLDADYGLSPGYKQMLGYALAEHLQDPFGKQLSASFLRRAAMLRKLLKRSHVVVPLVDTPSPVRWNILSGD